MMVILHLPGCRPGRALDPGLPGGCRIARGRPAGEEDRPVRRHAPRDDRRERIGGLPPGRAGRVGVTAEGDRLFVEAVLHRCRAGIPWRDLPERPGARKKVRTRFARRARAGGRGASDTSPAGPTTSTRWSTAPSSAPAGTAPGRRRDGIGRRGGRARPGRPEHRAPRRRRRARRPDRPRAPARAGARPRARRRLAAGPGRGGADRRQGLRRRGAGARAARAGRAAVIPPRAGRESPRPHDREPRAARPPVENPFAGLKRPRATAPRHDGRAVPFPSAIHLAATVIWPDRGHALAVWLRDLVRDYALEALADAAAVLVLDETGFLKRGRSSCGVARQYTGPAGKVTDCQAGVFAACASRHGHALVDRAL